MVWLGLGANIGNRLDNIRKSIDALCLLLTDVAVSSLYETAAQDYTDQPDFLNAVLRGSTPLTPELLLEEIHHIEKAGGRYRTSGRPKGPRTIDIDILLYGRDIQKINFADGRDLEIPHRSMDLRLFVLKPLLELDPDLTDPRDGVSWAEKASHLSGQRVKLYLK